MSTLTRDARWRTAILALRATHSTKAFEEAGETERSEEDRREEGEEDRSEEDRSAEGSFPKRSEESIFLFSGSFFGWLKKRILLVLTVLPDFYY
jgi:hypothetical protein